MASANDIRFTPPTSGERVVVYTTSYCTYCVMAKRLLQSKRILFVERDVTGDDTERAWLVEATGRRTVPQVFIDGRPVGGSDDLHALARSGELDRLLAAPAAT